MLHLLIFGPQLSGKGTQADRIAKHYGLAHLTTGGILREMYAKAHVEKDAKTQALLQPSMEGGKLLSDEEMRPILERYLDEVKTGWVLDGYPRTLAQMGFLDAYLRARKAALDAAILVDISKEEIAKRRDYRIKTEGRADDKDDSVLDFRLRQYFEKTVPVVEAYKRQGILLEINGEQSRDEVFAQIKRELTKALGAKC